MIPVDMMNIPVNRWTVGAVIILTAIFGGDFVSAIMKAITVIGASYVPAL